ncbi:MAG: hypothetical protein AB9922_02550 [Bacteroidales bacterium]
MMVSKQRTLPIITAIILFICASPYFVWGLLSIKFFIPLLTILVGFIFMSQMKLLTKLDGKLIVLYVLTAALIVFLSIINGSRNTYGVISQMLVFFLLFIPFGKDSFIKNVYYYFVIVYSVTITLSLISWILILTGTMPSLDILQSPFELREYIHYPFVVVQNNLLEAVRFAGPFDEPGVVGTFSAIILCIQKFNFRDWKTVVVFVAGLFSLSMFFYAIAAIYGFIYLFFFRKKIMFMFLFIGSFAVFYYTTKENELLYKTIWERFEWEKDSQRFKGDNRISDTGDAYYNSLKGSAEFYWGVDDITKFWNYAKGASSYKAVIANNGVIFFSLYLFFFISLAYSYRKDFPSLALFIFILFMNTYQRPDIYGITIMFLYSYLARSSKF